MNLLKQREAVAIESEREGGRPRGISVEAAAWIGVALLSLALRLVALDAAPLSASEAGQATLAWRAVAGQSMPGAESYSPLLFSANALLFWLFGASDSVARLLPALAGAALALTPVLMRKRLGRVGTLAAGCYLAISPTALFASRQVDGLMIAALGAMLLVGGLIRFSESRDRRWFLLGAAGLAVTVASSPSSYGLLVGIGLAW
ncbi:MAG: hypothetical protein E3J64_06110, partial [Anaerolineales bacterium]